MLVKNVIWFYFICPDLPPTLLPPVFVFVVLVQRGRSAQRRTSSSSSMVWTRLSSTNQTTVTPLCPFSLKPSISSLPGSNWWSRSEQHYRCLWTNEKLCVASFQCIQQKIKWWFISHHVLGDHQRSAIPPHLPGQLRRERCHWPGPAGLHPAPHPQQSGNPEQHLTKRQNGQHYVWQA